MCEQAPVGSILGSGFLLEKKIPCRIQKHVLIKHPRGRSTLPGERGLELVSSS